MKMKFEIQSRLFLSRLAATGRAVPSKTPIQILSCFLLELDGEWLTATASDQENTVSTRMKVDSPQGGGRICVDAKRLLSLLKLMPDGRVSVEAGGDDSVRIRYASGEYKLQGADASQYPVAAELSESEVAARIELPTEALLSAVDKVAYAVCADDFHPQLQGILMDFKEDSVVFVATDTHQLAKFRTTRVAPGAERRITLPTRAAQALRGVVGKEASVSIAVAEKCAVFKGEDFTMKSQLLGGAFPNYNRVIPQGCRAELTVDREALLSAVGRVSLCADQATSLIRMRLERGRMTLEAQDAGYAAGATETVECGYGGEDMVVGFSSEYLFKAVTAAGTPRVRMRFQDEARPVLVLPSENEEHSELTLIVCPMNISQR